MAVTPRQIIIVGCGPGSPLYLTEAARLAAAQAEVVVGNQRLLALFPEHAGTRFVGSADITPQLEAIAEAFAAGLRVAVLVSGDPGLFSLAAKVVRRFGAEACEIIPGISSVQVAFARLGLDWIDAKILSAHGRVPQTTPEALQPFDKIAILAGTGEALRWSAQAAQLMRASHAAILCENLTLADERVRLLSPEELAAEGTASLAIVLLIRRSLLPMGRMKDEG